MKLTASEFISKAEGLKSSELSLRQRIEVLQSQHNSLRNAIERQEYRIDSLEAQIASLEAEEDDEDGPDNSAEISQLQAEIAAAYSEIQEYEQEDSLVQSELQDANSELRDVEREERETLSDIEDSATRTNQNMSIIASIGGDYANVAGTAADSFRHNLSQMAQAAQILGGNVTIGSYTSGSSGKMNANGTFGAASRNFYEAANNQRKSAKSSMGSLGASGNGSSASARKLTDSNTGLYYEEEAPAPKMGGLGKKVSTLKQSITNALNLAGATKEFSGCTAIKRADQQDCWDIPGTGFTEYDDFRNNHGDYERITYDTSRMGMAPADNIEGISNIRTADVEHPEIFWGRDSGKTMDDFIAIAQHIPEVAEQLKSGRSLNDLMMDDRLGQCASIYYAGAPTVYKGDGFYEFSGNGRHRVLAARALGLAIPVVIAGEIRNKKQGGFGKRQSFIESIKYSPAQGTAAQSAKPTNGTSDTSKGQLERDIVNEYYRDSAIVGAKTQTGMGKKAGKTGHFSENYKSVLKKRLTNADRDTRRAFEKLTPKLKIRDDQYYDTPHYWEIDSSGRLRGVYLNAEVDETNPRGEGSTYFHELGHMVDHAAADFQGHASDNIEFKEALQKDSEYILSLFDRMSLDQKRNLANLLQSDTLHSVEDLLEGLTQGRIRGKWGHGAKYWNDRPNGIQREAFAHFFEARMGGGRKQKYLKKFFPNSSAVFDNLMGNIANGGDV